MLELCFNCLSARVNSNLFEFICLEFELELALERKRNRKRKKTQNPNSNPKPSPKKKFQIQQAHLPFFLSRSAQAHQQPGPPPPRGPLLPHALPLGPARRSSPRAAQPGPLSRSRRLVGLSPSDEGGASRGYLGGLVSVWFPVVS